MIITCWCHTQLCQQHLAGDLASNCLRVLSKQWQGEFCRCSINVVGGKQRDGGIDHLERFRHHTGPSAKAGKPMTQPTVDPLNCHRFILADIVPPNRQERVVRRIVVCTVQLQGFSRSSNRFSVAASRPPHSQSMRQSDQKPTRSTACSFFEGNARARPIPSRPRPRPALVEGAPRALPHELGSNSGSTGLKRRVAWRWHSSTGTWGKKPGRYDDERGCPCS